ncbi:MAG: porin family protein [Dysgonamonadaceae bacterium]
MKKLLSLFVLAFTACAMNAQINLQSAHIKLNYATEREQVGIGAQARLGITQNLRISPDAIIYFPKNHTTALDVNANLEYAIPLQSNASLYPLAGISMVNTRYSYKGISNSNTEFGFNLGAGFDYNFSSKNYVNIEYRYTFNDWDFSSFSIGYGFKF